uniref:RNA polymerase, sigma-24 subunit, ECF subfamily n=2 Tax=Rubinisphaera brasiliensis TaxID=119 RepID=F0SGH6_RUBBR|nr:RNA polymerase, sigma-24 subunit, ECF subfamily [Rubinisphaera brasiliensis DSM 5305]
MNTSDEFLQLITECQGWLYGYLLGSLANHDAANEVLQETNLVMWRKSAEFEVGTNFHAWAIRIANFQVMAYRQKQMKDRLVFDHDLVELIGKQFQKRIPGYEEKVSLLAKCLNKLPEHYREIVHRRYLKGESLKTIAVDLKKQSNAIGQLLFRIKNKLVECVKKQNRGALHVPQS